MTIGDVLAVVGVITGICLSLWALLIGSALLFEGKAQAARRVLETQARGALGLGALLVATLGVLAVVLLNAPGGFKILGWALLLALLATSLLGGAGLALLLGERTGAQAPQMAPLSALARGAGLMALAWIFPILGWFLVAPVSVMIGLGTGAKVLLAAKRKAVEHSAPALFLTDEVPCESPAAIG